MLQTPALLLRRPAATGASRASAPAPWDPKESLPSDYARVFAFENSKRAHKRAKEAQQRATAEQDPCSVGMGGWRRAMQLRDQKCVLETGSRTE